MRLFRFGRAGPTSPPARPVPFRGPVEAAAAQGACYRGKVLSLEAEDDHRGTVNGLKVHCLRPVRRDDVILPRATLELLDRNVIEFVGARPRLRELGLATRKGILFHGPPGDREDAHHPLPGPRPAGDNHLPDLRRAGRVTGPPGRP